MQKHRRWRPSRAGKCHPSGRQSQ